VWKSLIFAWFNIRMAKQTVVTEILVDDLDGSAAERTIRFSWDGVSYELELSKKNAVALEKTIRPYIAAARRSKGTRSRRGSGATTRGSKRDWTPVREWAAKNGFGVSTRGRVSQTVIDAYEAANS
jgi:hypothetical protein